MEICLLYDYSIDGFSIKTKYPYGDLEEINYSCGSSRRDSLRKHGHDISTFCLYHIDEDGTGMHRLLKSIKEGYKPEAVFLMHAGSLKHNLVDLWEPSNFHWANGRAIALIAEGGDEWRSFDYNFPHNSKSHLVLTCDNEAAFAYMQRGVQAEWFPVWADERVFFNDNRERTVDISTTAVPTEIRNARGFLHLNDAIQNHFGERFQNPMRHRQGMSYIPMMENGDLFRRSKIVFQCSSSGEMTRRIVEGAACGAVVVTDELAVVRKINSLFVPNQSIVYYKNAEECIIKMELLLENDERRKEIAADGEARILKYHTGEARALDLLNHIENYFGRY